MPLPNFLILGTQKAGTTWLAETLGGHPDVFVAPHEIHFFDKDCNFARGINWYERHFDAARGASALGEKTPDYLWPNGRGTDGHSPDVHRRVREVLPDARFVVVLRDPVERAISAARHLIRDGWVSPLESLDELLVGGRSYLAEEHGVIDYGRYERHLRAYFELFPPEHFLILFYEDELVADPPGTLARVCEFLDVDPSFPFARIGERRNEFRQSFPRLLLDYYAPPLRRLTGSLDRVLRPARYQVRASTRRRLQEIFRDEDERLFELLGRRPRGWS